jgi:hypothetical protein
MLSQTPRFSYFIFGLLTAALTLSSCSGGGGSADGGDTLSLTGTMSIDNGSLTATVRLQPALVEFVRPAFAAGEAEPGPSLVGATITLFNSAGAVVDSTETDDSGQFSFYDLSDGSYSIAVAHDGINPIQINNIEVLSGDTAIVNGIVTTDGAETSVGYNATGCLESSADPLQIVNAQGLADISGVPLEQVLELRGSECLGWDALANALGVEQGSLGLGRIESRGGGIIDQAAALRGSIVGGGGGSFGSASTPPIVSGSGAAIGGGTTPTIVSGSTPSFGSASTPPVVGGTTPPVIGGSTPPTVGGTTPPITSGSPPSVVSGGTTPPVVSGVTPGVVSGSGSGVTTGSNQNVTSGGGATVVDVATPGVVNGSFPDIITD